MGGMPESGHLLRRGLRTIVAMVRLEPRLFALAITGATVYAVAVVGSSVVIGHVTDTVIIPRFEHGHVRTALVGGGVLAIVAVGLAKAAGIITRRIFATRANAGVQAQLRSQVVGHYQAVPYSFHQRMATGELLSHAGTDVDAVADVLAPLPFATGVIVLIVVSLAWLLSADPFLALVGLVVFPAFVGTNALYERRVEAPAEQAQEHLGAVAAIAHESFEGALVVKALGAEQLESARFRAAASELRDAKLKVASTRATFDATLDALPVAAITVLLPLGAWRISTGALSIGDVVAFVNLFSIIVWPLRLIGFVLGEIPRAVAGHDRVNRVLREVTDPRHALAPSPTSRAVTERGAELRVERVSFAFDAGHRVLDDVSFSVTAGQTVAVVGPTGAGKSTLLHLIAGLVDPTSGAVLLDGDPLASYTTGELRERIAMAFQEAFLFGDSVVDNILLGDGERDGDDRDGDRLAEVAALAGVTGFAQRLPAGFETVVGERGATLSGGQRQRVALARALARRPRLLLLDDATSAVDPTTEAQILAALRANLTSTTTLVVASRPSTIALADEVLYLEHGQLVDHGPHDELLARCHRYEELVRAYELDRVDRGLP